MGGFGYGQFGAGGFGETIISRKIMGTLYTTVNTYSELSLVDEYSDGTKVAIADLIWTTSNPNITFVSNTGLVLGLITGVVNISALDPNTKKVLATTSFTVNPVSQYPTNSPSSLVVSKFSSHITQVAQNYYDPVDTNIRSSKYSLGSQLLNTAAQQIQLSGLRLSREIKATSLHACPANIDNGGVYYQQNLPSSFDYEANSHTVLVVKAGVPEIINLYRDELPIPTRVNLNPNYLPVALSNPILFTTSGIGIDSPQTTAWACQRFGPFAPALPNRLHFWVNGSGFDTIKFQVKIIGQKSPAPAWSDAQSTASETITMYNLGWFESKFAWSNINTIQILGLPVNVSITGYIGMFALPQTPDVDRPYTDHRFRDVLFNRYWSTSTPGFLVETYLRSDYAGWEDAQAYVTSSPITSVVAEPNTWGGFAASGTTLYYFDRREPLPSSNGMKNTGITAEPYYSLHVTVETGNLYPIYLVSLIPIAGSNADNTTAYRYTIQTPDNNTYVIMPEDGVFATYNNHSGWRAGPPTGPLYIPLGQTGEYVFTLETSGPNGVLFDSTPWLKLEFNPLATFDLSAIVPYINGLSFDDRNRLWVWAGSYAVPIQLHYDAYLIDATSQSIYLTDSVDGLVIDGIVL